MMKRGATRAMNVLLSGVTSWLMVSMGGCATAGVGGGAPAIADGVFDEWTLSDQIATDDANDASGAFDVTELWTRSAGTVVVLRFTTAPVGGQELNVQSGSSGDGTLRFRFERPGGDSLTIDLRGRRLYENDDTGNVVSWSSAGFHSAPTHSAREFELRVDLGVIGASQGETIELSVSGSDALDAPAMFTLADPSAAPTRESADRAPEADFRIVALNTQNNGLVSGSRGPRLQRVLDALDSEIICLQEEGSSSEAQIRAALENADPLETGADWIAHKNNDQFVAVDSSVASLIPVPENDNNFASALVEFHSGEAVLVFSIHPKCCGFTGSSEDQQRIDQMALLIETLDQFRAGQFGPTLAAHADAPAIVIGDWNLVGSRIPLDMIEDPQGPALETAFLRNLIGGGINTWFGSNQGAGAFTPGRLDLASHDADLALHKSFIFDTSSLNQAELSALGVLASDSLAADHRALVLDLSFGGPSICIGDADSSGAVNFADITSVLGAWLSAGPEGDANIDGIVNFQDVTDVLANWLAVCS